MTMEDIRNGAGNSPLVVGVSVAIVSGIIGFFVATYSANYGAQLNAQAAISVAQATEIQTHALKIERLDADERNSQTAIAALNVAVGQLSDVKSAVETLTDVTKGLQQKVDAMDHWLRPDPNLPSRR